MTLAGRVSGRCEARPPDRAQYLGGGGGVNSGADDQRAVGVAMGARKQRAGPGAQVRDRLGRVGQFEREHVPGEAVTPGERQATGRGAAQDFEAGARLGAGQPGDGAAFRDAQGCGGVALQHTPPACARRGNRDRVLVGAGQFLARRLIRQPP
jgi:hypothetical protein